MYWFPKTKLGKVSFFAAIISWLSMMSQYWLQLIFPNTNPDGPSVFMIIPGFLGMFIILCAGICSVIAFTKYKDKAILLLVPAFIGLMGVLFVIGELIFPH